MLGHLLNQIILLYVLLFLVSKSLPIFLFCHPSSPLSSLLMLFRELLKISWLGILLVSALDPLMFSSMNQVSLLLKTILRLFYPLSLPPPEFPPLLLLIDPLGLFDWMNNHMRSLLLLAIFPALPIMPLSLLLMLHPLQYILLMTLFPYFSFLYLL